MCIKFHIEFTVQLKYWYQPGENNWGIFNSKQAQNTLGLLFWWEKLIMHHLLHITHKIDCEMLWNRDTVQRDFMKS